MSIINQVLKDLDQQRGPAGNPQIAALQGIGLVRTRAFKWPGLYSIGTAVLVLALVGFALFRLAGIGTVDSHSTGAEPVEEPAQNTPQFTPLIAQPEPQAINPVVVKSVEPVPEQAASEESVDVAANESPAITQAEHPSPKPVKTLSIRQRAEHAYAAGQKARRKHDNVSAEQLFNSALELRPKYVDARIQLAAIHLERNDTNAAEELLKEGLALEPAQAQLVRLYSQLLSSRGEYEPALLSLAPVADTSTPDAESLALRAAIYARLDKHKEAAADYRAALKLEPEQANWWMGLGLSLEHQGLYGNAMTAYRNADSLPLESNVKAFVKQRLAQLQNTAGDN
jgi:MSHA biogenesis protein MshN